MNLGRVIVAAAMMASAIATTETPVAAAPGSVVINEIHYHPATDPDELNDIDDHEFLELHNPGDTAVDLTGYTIGPVLDPAFILDAPLSGVLAPGAYVILAPTGADTFGQWGVVPIGTYTGKLSNGGELVELLDAADIVVDSVEYDDKTPWPTSPDGNGPSLELIDPASDNNIASSWAASNPSPTPGAENSVFSNPPAAPISNITLSPTAPTPGQTTTVTATIPGGAAPDLVYVIDFGSEVTLPMANVGADTFAATIPAQAAGELVRYKIDAPGAGTQAPTGNDGRRYLGYVVDDPSVVTTASLMEWFIPETDYDLMFDDPLADVTVSGSVLAINGVVYDNVDTSIRGGTFARTFRDKQGISIDLPSGVTMSDGALVPYAIDEFALGVTRGVDLPLFVDSAWTIMEAAGFPVVHSEDVRVQRNGEFYGIYRFSEKLDGTWRSENNIDGEFWKVVLPGFNDPTTGFDQKQPDTLDQQPILDLVAVLNMSAGPAKTEAIYEIFDIPNAVNWMAAIYAIGHVDSRNKNFYLERNTDGRWMIYPWDLTNTFDINTGNCDGSEVDLTCVDSLLWDSLREVPEVEDMLWRRLRTIIDGPMGDGVLEGQYATYYQSISVDEQQLDRNAWTAVPGLWATPAQANNGRIDGRRNAILADSNLPPSQSTTPNIVINEIHYNPADGGVEFVELFNPTSEAVDLSDWELDGVGLDFPGGTVILPGTYVIATEDIEAFSALYPAVPNPVLVEFSGGVSNGGETLQLLDQDSALIDEVSYDDEGGWVTEPDGNGPSLALIDPASNNNLAASWLLSGVDGGSPGVVNSPVEPTIDQATVLPVGCQIYSSADDGPLAGGESRTIQTVGPIPASQAAATGCELPADATAVTVTITADNPTTAGNLRLIPAGGTINGGVVNYAPNGLNNSNTVTIPVGPDGELDLSANAGPAGIGALTAGVSIAVLAYYHPDGDLRYHSLTPCAARDTRASEGAANPGPFSSNALFNVDVKGTLPAGNGGASDCGVPDSANAVLVNVVAITSTGAGRIDVNSTATTSFAPIGMNNASTTVVNQDGLSTFELELAVASGSVDFRVVVLGYFATSGGSDFVAVSPCVGFDTRTGQSPAGVFAGPRDGGQTTTYDLTGAIPAVQGGGGSNCGVPDDATGVLLNLVAIGSTAVGNLQASASGAAPTGGVLNFANVGMNNSNAVPVALSAGGTIDIFVNTGPTNAADATDIRGVILGYYVES